MKNSKKITIEALAIVLGKKLFTKSATPRIYLDRGHSTKKMTTTTYIFEIDGEFKVSCFIDCPSQPMAWINSQKDEVIEGVYSEIETALKKASNPEKYSNMPYKGTYVAHVCAPKKEVVATVPVVAVVEKFIPKNENSNFEIGEKVEHNKFGIGTVVECSAEKIIIEFEIGKKELLQKFVTLKKVA